MKSSRRVIVSLLSSLGLMAALPSCVVVDPGYVAVSTGYSMPRSSGYCAPAYVAPAPCYSPPPVCHHHCGW